ncbi:MAG TPA: hypothetical protein VIO14_04375 [Dehalococcoidia bacterium]
MGGIEIWDLWYPNAAAQGLPFARGRLRATDVLLVHAAPDTLRVEVRDDAGALLAFGDQLRATADRPITRLRREGDRVVREDLWPGPEDLGRPVILPGGEVGILQSWWNAPDGQEWRWTAEFYNHR